jgi:hypothetical protein
MTAEGIRLVVAREGRKQIDRIELDLLAATKTDEVVTLVVPGHGGPDFDLALEYVRWVVAELTERDIKVAVHYRAVENGVALALEDVMRPRRARRPLRPTASASSRFASARTTLGPSGQGPSAARCGPLRPRH